MTKIEWTHRPGTTGETWNPIRARNTKTGKIGWHCEKITEGCDGCYACDINARLGDSGGTGFPYKPGHLTNGDVEVYLDEIVVQKPLHWRKPRTIFVCSMTDLFADFVRQEWIDKVFAVAALCPQHTFIILTKRAQRMNNYVATESAIALRRLAYVFARGTTPLTQHEITATIDPDASSEHRSLYHVLQPKWPLPNVWLGVSAENQRRADERIPLLLATPAAIRFVSCEPLLGPIDLTRLGSIDVLRKAMPAVVSKFKRVASPHALSGMQIEALGKRGQAVTYYQTPDHMGGFSIDFPRLFPRLDWVICGGESGKKARPMHPDWARSLRDQCATADVPFFFKQWGEWSCFYDRDHHDPDCRSLPGIDNQMGRRATRWHNLAGGIGFHGERVVAMRNVGKAEAGRILDHRVHNEFPTVAAKPTTKEARVA